MACRTCANIPAISSNSPPGSMKVNSPSASIVPTHWPKPLRRTPPSNAAKASVAFCCSPNQNALHRLSGEYKAIVQRGQYRLKPTAMPLFRFSRAGAAALGVSRLHAERRGGPKLNLQPSVVGTHANGSIEAECFWPYRTFPHERVVCEDFHFRAVHFRSKRMRLARTWNRNRLAVRRLDIAIAAIAALRAGMQAGIVLYGH